MMLYTDSRLKKMEGMLSRVLTLQEYTFIIAYRNRTQNANTGALSQRSETPEAAAATAMSVYTTHKVCAHFASTSQVLAVCVHSHTNLGGGRSRCLYATIIELDN